MNVGRLNKAIRQLLHGSALGPSKDRDLLERFVAQRDADAFATLVGRHGPMVLALCRRILGHEQDAEDAFQATFVVLARKASSVPWRESVGNWLYGVACRTALRLRTRAGARRHHEHQAASMRTGGAVALAEQEDARSMLDEELVRLPDRYRQPLLLCYLQGLTRDEAARELGWTPGMVKGNLERGKEYLRGRLIRRGCAVVGALPTPLLTPAEVSAVPAPLAAATVQAAVTGVTSAAVTGLTQGVMHAMFYSKLRRVALILLAFAVVASGAQLIISHRVLAGRAADTAPAATADEPVAGDGHAPREALEPAENDNDLAIVRKPYVIDAPDVLTVESAQILRDQPIKGQYQVQPDGTIGLGIYGTVAVAGLTLEQAHQAVADVLGKRINNFDPKSLAVDLYQSNSKFYYIISDDGPDGAQVVRQAIKGPQTVLDAISQVKGLAAVALQRKVWIARPEPDGKQRILKVDWRGIALEGRVTTNFPLMAGDRLYVVGSAAAKSK